MKVLFNVIFLFVFFFFLHFPVFSLDFFIYFDSGIKQGITNEFVYEGDKCISRLDWKDEIVPVLNITGMLKTHNIFLKLGMLSVVPVKSGVMEDFDYLVTGSTKPSHYSQHDTFLDKDFRSKVECGYDFIFEYWHITPSVGFQYFNRKWTASNGFLQYPSTGLWTGDEFKTLINGSVISYEQAVWFPFCTIEVGYDFTFGIKGKIYIGLNGSIYPYIWANTNDTHFLRNVQFYDDLKDGIGWCSVLTISFYPENLNGLGFIFRSGHEALLKIKGNTSSSSTGIYSGPLVIDEGFSAKMESNYWFLSVGIIVPVNVK